MMDGLGFGFHAKSGIVTAMDLKLNVGGPVIVNVGISEDMGEGLLRSGAADLVAYGRLYIGNPDLVERFKNKWPLNPDPGYHAWYDAKMGPTGYTDQKPYTPEE
jgi:N-ethylmaleimide reductase